jgi:hypothetical protein
MEHMQIGRWIYVVEGKEYKEEWEDHEHEKEEGVHGAGNIGEGEGLCGEWKCGGQREMWGRGVLRNLGWGRTWGLWVR